MDLHDSALVVAGIIGSGVAIIHGVRVQQRIVKPLQDLATTRMHRSMRILVPGLLHFSTFNWFVGGLALLACAVAGGSEARLATGILVGSLPLRRARQRLGIAGPPPRMGSLRHRTHSHRLQRPNSWQLRNTLTDGSPPDCPIPHGPRENSSLPSRSIRETLVAAGNRRASLHHLEPGSRHRTMQGRRDWVISFPQCETGIASGRVAGAHHRGACSLRPCPSRTALRSLRGQSDRSQVE